MDAFLDQPAALQARILTEAAARLNLPPRIVEKDFWVCWTLRELFALSEWAAHLTFKGGTSLSKGWGLIDRFSEDIDVVIDRAFLGFAGERFSNNQLGKLKRVCAARIAGDLLPALSRRVADRLGEAGWELTVAEAMQDPDLQTLLFRYPTLFAEQTGYVTPVVRIELGARSDTDPAERPDIQPLLGQVLPNVLTAATFSVRAVAPRRTFWEKAMLVHEETWRPPGRPRKARMSRHYYDLWCLITRAVAAAALRDEGLFERVATHRRHFFRYTWLDYGTLAKGRLRMLPLPEQEAEWRQDYAAMRGEMFLREPPPFDEILRVVGEFERTFNAA
jgi:hypothetical protein